jgi:hypothetical protein
MTPQLNQPRPNLVIVDDFLADPDAVRALALRQRYVRNHAQYKVQRSEQRFLWPGVKERFEHYLGRKITRWEEHGFNGCFQVSLGGDQVVYHSDAQSYAAVIYLTPQAPPEAGTVLVRSRATGGRTPEESARLRRIPLALAQRQMYEDKLLDPTAWEVVDVIGNVYNRLAIWNARLCHAGNRYFGTRVDNGRLVQMYFFDCEGSDETV